MTDYIERGKLPPEASTDGMSCSEVIFAVGYNACLKYVKSIPAADVRPVVRGKWIQTTQPMGWRDEDCAECSVCGEDFVLDEWAMDEFTNLMNFCPNCGADMREANDEKA